MALIVAKQWRMFEMTNRTALMAAQLLYDVLQDKMNNGICINLDELLSFGEIIKLAGISSASNVNKVLREIVVQGGGVTHGDLWIIEHHLRTGLERNFPRLSDAKAALELLRLFWEEKAETGEVLSVQEVVYVQFMLGRLDIIPEGNKASVRVDCDDEQLCSDMANPMTTRQPLNRLPGKESQRQALKSMQKATAPGCMARLAGFMKSLWPDKQPIRKSPRLRKQPWATQKLMSRLIEYIY